MVIGIVGMGVIGASLAKAIKLKTEHKVLGYDKNHDINIKAKILRVVDDTLAFDNICDCSVVILAVGPTEALRILKEHSTHFTGCEAVLDLCGVKKVICDEAFRLAEKAGFTFVGGDPIVECAKSGFNNSSPSLFDGASLALTPSFDTPIHTLDLLKRLFTRVGFGNIEICTPNEHDRVTAFTLLLSRVIAGAYIKSPSANEHYGLSAESYEAISKNAVLDEKLWADLLFANKDNVEGEIDALIQNLRQYSDALKANDVEKIKALFADGKKTKEYIDYKNDILNK